MRFFFSTYTNRICKCRLCDYDIDKLEIHVMLKAVHVSPKYVDLRFHTKCFQKAQEGLYDER